VTASSDAHYTAAETARRLGVSVRALRVYERHGIVRPNRTAVGWRVYGADEISRLHQVIALKRVGLKLAQIAKLVRGNTVPLDQLLGLQEEELVHRKQQTDRALALVRKARKHIAEGKTLPLDDFISLIKESRMPDFELSPEYKALWAKHINPDRLKAVHPDWSTDSGVRFKARWVELIAEAEQLKDGDPGSPQALDLARRALSLVGEFTRFDPELMVSLKAVFQEGYASPDTAPHMPYSQGVRRFMDAAVEHLHAAER
jgi:DNA-binding transcriptional MerR regulator